MAKELDISRHMLPANFQRNNVVNRQLALVAAYRAALSVAVAHNQ